FGAVRPFAGHAGALYLGDRRRDELDLLAAERPRLARVRVDPAKRDARPFDAERLQCGFGCAQGADDARTGDERERLAHACMQRDMRDAHFPSRMLEAKHEHRFLRRQPADARDERRVAIELEPARVDRRFGVRRADHRIVFAGERALDGDGRRFERRAPVLGRHRADARRRLLDVADIELVERDAARRGVHGEHLAAADEHRVAERAHLRMALGVLGGPTMANHATASKPGKVSASAGTPGSEAMRFALATASALSFPERTWGSDTPRLSHIMSTWPPSRSVSAGAVPL